MPLDRPPLYKNAKLLSWASCLNEIADEMISPLLPQFLIIVLGGNRFHLGLIEGVAGSGAILLKLWAGAWPTARGAPPFLDLRLCDGRGRPSFDQYRPSSPQ